MNGQHIRHAIGLGFIALGFGYFYLIPSQPGIGNMQSQWLAQTENAKAQEAALKATGQNKPTSGAVQPSKQQPVVEAPAERLVQDCIFGSGEKICATRKENEPQLTVAQIQAKAKSAATAVQPTFEAPLPAGYIDTGYGGSVRADTLTAEQQNFARQQGINAKATQAKDLQQPAQPAVLAPRSTAPAPEPEQTPVMKLPAPKPAVTKPAEPKTQGVNAMYPRQDVKPGQKTGGDNDQYSAAQERADESKLDAWAKKAQGH